jgi:large subunit ribosomal protein L3
MEGLIGKKLGMTQVWDDQGQFVPVTVLEVGPCPVVQIKQKAREGYDAAQVGFRAQKPQRLTNALRTRFEKAGVPPCRELREFKLDAGHNVKVGDTITVALFEGVKLVDVTAISKGRGFAGAVCRFRMAGGPYTHGGHSKRRIGGIGERNLPGWIRKGKPMPGHMGAARVTTRNLAVVQVRPEDNVLLVHGAVPGPVGGRVIVKKALKQS